MNKYQTLQLRTVREETCRIRPCYEISHSSSNIRIGGLESLVIVFVTQALRQDQFLSCHISRQTLPHRDAPYKGNWGPTKARDEMGAPCPATAADRYRRFTKAPEAPYGQQPGNVAKKRGAHRSVTEQNALVVLRATAHPCTARSSSLGGCPLA